MPQYRNSRQIGYNSWTNGAWSSFMNSYAATPFNTGANSGMSGTSFSGSTNVTAPWSGVYTIRAATDDSGNINMGGASTSTSGYNGGGNTASRFFNKGNNIGISWSVQNSTSADSFNLNPCAIAWTLDGPSQPPAPSASLSASPTTIIRGQGVTLSWSGSGSYLYGATLTDVSNPGFSGSAQVFPQDDKTYTYTVTAEGGNSSASRTITVYIPPTLNLTVSPNPIVAGTSATVSWNTTGDGDTITWLSGNLTNLNATSSSTVSPLDTITYSGYVTGLGGTSPTESVTLLVYQIPVVNLFDTPETILYGQQGNISYDVEYANISITIDVYYDYGSGYQFIETINFSNLSDSAEIGVGTTNVTNTFSTNIVYNDQGPRFVQYILNIQGDGGVITENKVVTIEIDETPDNFVVPETDEKIKEEDPVYTPDIVPDQVLTSDLLSVNGIDIPVEIKSNYPIKVIVNESGVGENVREI